MLTIYLLWTIPFFFVAFMFFYYKTFGYITVTDAVVCLVVACLPIMRECALIATVINHKYHRIGDIVLFGEKK